MTVKKLRYGRAVTVRCRVLAFWLDEKCLRAIWLVEKISSMLCRDRAVRRDFSHSLRQSMSTRTCNAVPCLIVPYRTVPWHWRVKAMRSDEIRLALLAIAWRLPVVTRERWYCFASLYLRRSVPWPRREHERIVSISQSYREIYSITANVTIRISHCACHTEHVSHFTRVLHCVYHTLHMCCTAYVCLSVCIYVFIMSYFFLSLL
jgi:hypothetical protein